VPIVLKSGRLKLLEPSGPVKASNRIALPLPEDGQELKSKYGGLIVNKSFVIQIVIKYYIVNTVALIMIKIQQFNLSQSSIEVRKYHDKSL
jgi:hypothetical protein